MESVPVCPGVSCVHIPEHDLEFLCGSPPDAVKHLMKRGLIRDGHKNGVASETGPNAILLSDVPVQNGGFANLPEFPILQMFYRQGMVLPNHPNFGRKPLVAGASRAVAAVAEALFRGTYGLANEAEIREAGVGPDQAAEILRQKLWFSFGSLRKSEELLELAAFDGEAAVELRPGLTLRRTGVNLFRFSVPGQDLDVDLNLPAGQVYPPAFRLGRSRLSREYFSVVHLGEGDGWDVNRPCMGSLLQFQGRNFLIDAGPHILESLEAVGLGLTEIEGLFMTHGHDDHFAGLPSLAMSDHRLKFFSTRLVRSSVMKKMAALMGVPERTFSRTFDFHELPADEWTDVEGLLVRPSWSPHPVETNIYSFRANGEEGTRTYCHWGDIASFAVLKKLLLEAPGAGEASRDFYQSFTRMLLEPADLKKVDIGGGMIHGAAEDFAADASSRLVLAHIGRPPTIREKEIGTFVEFGVQDVLLPARQDYRMRMVHAALDAYFPQTPVWERDMILNGTLKEVSPGTILQRRGEVFDRVLLVVSGLLEGFDADSGLETRYTAGSLVGELHVLTGRLSGQTIRARSFATVLEIPKLLFTIFTRKNTDIDDQLRIARLTLELHSTALFGDSVSSLHLTRVARQAVGVPVALGTEPRSSAGVPAGSLYLVEKGSLALEFEGQTVEVVGPGDFCGEENLIFRGDGNLAIRALEPSRVWALPSGPLLDIPIVGWKLIEAYERRLSAYTALLASR